MGSGRGYTDQDCSLARALEVIGERWTLLVLRDCFYGVRRFADFHAHLGVPRAVLTERLKTLTSLGVVERRPRPTGVEVDYLLTERGLDLWPAVHALAQWGERWTAPEGARRVFAHAPCGTDLTPTGHCPSCGTAPSPADLTIRQGPGADPTLRDDRVSAALRRGPHRLLTDLFTQ
ncbi:helix-turn-helix transcriptional regulator [Streptomyces sp. AV19]|uniref:winged helix-turn-helix transcriptional regulator n=1 Tax=Streptomyces sp. AV19 TaxID=2793068 RepID=UPI0018FE0FB2|nr:helix-turn-helix domain-containing protein [Streptomyces sp. AV19]MBH1935255.1 helix-turn-helix transcriptional regulator [Streptomyces sp. AV19]MDG4532071.1 helix-turn-helix transcriptional regulator [Streptomyces sp. AV19]